MSLAASCPRCPGSVQESGGRWSCADHGPITPLWRPTAATYEAFTEHLQRCGDMPTFLPWPLTPAWSVTDFGCVAGPRRAARATVTSCVGTSDPDGVVEVTLVAEALCVRLR